MAYTFDPNTPTEKLTLLTAQMVCEMHTRLFGNGQPGMLDQIEKRQDEMEERMEAVETWRESVISTLKSLKWLAGITSTAAGSIAAKVLFK